MRLFIAVNFNRETLSRLIALRDDLINTSRRGNFSSDENLHLTLVFLGECDANQTALVKTVMDETGFKPFTVNIDRVGCFRRGGTDIWWAGVRENAELLSLQKNLTDSLLYEGFSVDRRKYSPHITLGREVVTGGKPYNIEAFGETVGKIELMKSERIGVKLTYTVVCAKISTYEK
jgi:2'-5' RNA ligase